MYKLIVMLVCTFALSACGTMSSSGSSGAADESAMQEDSMGTPMGTPHGVVPAGPWFAHFCVITFHNISVEILRWLPAGAKSVMGARKFHYLLLRPSVVSSWYRGTAFSYPAACTGAHMGHVTVIAYLSLRLQARVGGIGTQILLYLLLRVCACVAAHFRSIQSIQSKIRPMKSWKK